MNHLHFYRWDLILQIVYGSEELGTWFLHTRGLARIKQVNKEPLKNWPSYIQHSHFQGRLRARTQGQSRTRSSGCREGQLKRQETQTELAFWPGVHNSFSQRARSQIFMALWITKSRPKPWTLPLWGKQPVLVANKWAWVCSSKTLWDTDMWVSCNFTCHKFFFFWFVFNHFKT